MIYARRLFRRHAAHHMQRAYAACVAAIDAAADIARFDADATAPPQRRAAPRLYESGAQRQLLLTTPLLFAAFPYRFAFA